jgi:hypothetical protein
MVEAGEPKDQDRAAWHAHARVAAVADGVTTSPSSARAANIATEFAAIMFGADSRARFHSLCDLLLAYRAAGLQNSRPTALNRSTEMQDILNDIVA